MGRWSGGGGGGDSLSCMVVGGVCSLSCMAMVYRHSRPFKVRMARRAFDYQASGQGGEGSFGLLFCPQLVNQIVRGQVFMLAKRARARGGEGVVFCLL